MVKCRHCDVCGKYEAMDGTLCYSCQVNLDTKANRVIKLEQDVWVVSKTEEKSLTYTELLHDPSVKNDPLKLQLVQRCIELSDELERVRPYLPSSKCNVTSMQNCHHCDNWECGDNLRNRKDGDV